MSIKKLKSEEKDELIELLVQEIDHNKEKIKERLKLDNQLLQLFISYNIEKISNYLKYIDLSEIDFKGIKIRGLNLSETNAKIDPQAVWNEDLEFTNLKGIDLRNANFDGVAICGANLEGTGAKIDPQTIWAKDLRGTNLKGLDLSDADFTGVTISGANLEDTGARINLETVYNQD